MRQLGDEEHQCSHVIVVVVQGTYILYRILLSLSVERVLLHNDRFCNGCITKRCLHNSKMGHIVTFHDCTMVKDESNKKCNVFCLVLNNVGYLMKGNLVRIKYCFLMQPLHNPPLCSNKV